MRVASNSLPSQNSGVLPRCVDLPGFTRYRGWTQANFKGGVGWSHMVNFPGAEPHKHGQKNRHHRGNKNNSNKHNNKDDNGVGSRRRTR